MAGSRRRMRSASAAILITALVIVAGCSREAVSHPPGTHVVLERGSVAGKGWKLVAWEDSKVLALWLESPSGDN
jgi:hypothetical protein